MRSTIMRPTLAALAAAAALVAAPAALAAPTCQTRQGQTIRCEVPGAMPVGWTLPPEEAVDPPPSPVELTQVLGLLWIAGLFGLIATLPDFDGRRDSDWLAPHDGKKRR